MSLTIPLTAVPEQRRELIQGQWQDITHYHFPQPGINIPRASALNVDNLQARNVRQGVNTYTGADSGPLPPGWDEMLLPLIARPSEVAAQN
jgi:hypothetical protein